MSGDIDTLQERTARGRRTRRRTTGPRQRRRTRERRLRRRRRRLGLVLVAAALAAVTGLATVLLTSRSAPPPPGAAPSASPAVVPTQDTLLLVRHAREGGPASGITLFAVGPGEATAVVMFLPAGALVEIPGVGLDRLALSYQYGGQALTQASVENTLGISVDHVAAVDDSGLAAFFGRTGGLTLDIPERLVRRDDSGAASVRFEPGEQFLDGGRLAEYWTFQGRQEDELARFPRQQLVLTRLLERLSEDPDVLDALLRDGAPQLATAAPADWLRSLFAALAEGHAADRLEFTLLPVEAFGGAAPDGSATYRVRGDATESLVEALFADSRPQLGGEESIRVQVLNGVGVPGIGRHVDRRLAGGGFRILLTDNARSFDFAETRIVVYDESERSLEAARRVQELLGVGTIQVSRQPQSVVDLTIVVGADFLDEVGVTPQPGVEGGPLPEETAIAETEPEA